MPQSNLRALTALLSPHKKYAACALAALVAANCAGLAFPWALKLAIDRVIPGRDIGLLHALAAVLFVAAVVKAACTYVREYLAAVAGERIVRELRGRVYRRVQELSVAHVENASSGELVAGMTQDIEAVRDFLSGGAIEFLYSACAVVLTLAALAALDPALALITGAAAPCIAAAFVYLNPRLKRAHAAVRAANAALTARVSEFLKGIRVIAGFGAEDAERLRFDRQQDEVFTATLGTHRLGLAAWLGAEFAGALGLIALLWYGAAAAMAGRMTAGELTAACTYAGMLFIPLVRMTVVNTFYQEASAAFDRIRTRLEAVPLVALSGKAVVQGGIRGGIRFEQVSFGYDGRRVFSGLDLTITPGETIALVGKSGAGKTTLINLLLRFYDPDGGRVLIDGMDLRSLDVREYRRRLAIVPQDDYLFNASIMDNIAYGNPRADVTRIRAAAAAACAHEFIAGLPEGYGTIVGEGGVRLSRGQRQRVSLARALLRDPAILVLDEATSSVDSSTEREIVENAYGNIIRGRTTIMIAHRLRAALIADRVVVMQSGRIVEAGTHDGLMELRGDYWRLWQAQTANEPSEAVISNNMP